VAPTGYHAATVERPDLTPGVTQAAAAAPGPAVGTPAPPLDGAAPAAGAPLSRPRAASLVLALLAVMPLGLLAQALSPPAGLVWTELVVFALPAVALVARAGLREEPFLRLGRPPRWALLLAVPMGGLAMVGGGAIQAAWSAVLPRALVDGFDVTRLFAGRPLSQLVLIFGAAVLAPVCEELAFRGHLLSALRLRWRTRDAIWLSALAFAAIHLDPVRFPALLFLGAVYGWMSWRTGSVWTAVVAHAVNNAAATALAVAWPEATRSSAVPQPVAEPLAALAASLALAAPLVLAYQRTMPAPSSPESALEAGDGAAGRWPAWAVRWAWAAAAALLLIVLFGRR